MSLPRCETCRHWDEGLNDYGTCRLISTNDPSRTNTQGIALASGCLSSHADFGCLLHEDKRQGDACPHCDGAIIGGVSDGRFVIIEDGVAKVCPHCGGTGRAPQLDHELMGAVRRKHPDQQLTAQPPPATLAGP